MARQNRDFKVGDIVQWAPPIGGANSGHVFRDAVGLIVDVKYPDPDSQRNEWADPHMWYTVQWFRDGVASGRPDHIVEHHIQRVRDDAP